jgi:allene oxide cyclase-like protein
MTARAVAGTVEAMRTLILFGAALAVGVSQIASASGGGTHTLRLKAAFEQEAMVDAAPAGESLGDTQVGSGRLTDASGHPAGRFGFTCRWVNVTHDDAQELCTAWGLLGNGGQLELQGMSRRESDHHTWAVVGGTGRYRGVRGEASIVDLDPEHAALTLRLIS